MRIVLLILAISFSLLTFAQKPTPIERERINVEMAINIQSYNSLSISIEKEFQYNKFYFGPRIEILNPFRSQTYVVDTILSMDWQLRIRLVQIEYQATERIRVGIAPLWLLAPVPRQGWYQTPSSLYACFWLDDKKTLEFEAILQTTKQGPFQLTLRKRL